MEKKKKSGFELLLDGFKEEQLLHVISSQTWKILGCARDAESAATKIEMALYRFLKLIEKELPPGTFWWNEELK